MNKKPITAVLLDAFNATAKKITLEPTLENYYRLLNCDLIEMPVRSVAGRPVRIICDEEAALKNDPIVSAVNEDNKPMLVGSLLFVGDDGSPDECSLPDDMCDWILDHVATALEMPTRRFVKVLTKCEYC